MPETPTSKRFTLVDKEDYRVELEYNDQYAILHLPTVAKFTKTVYQDMLVTVEDIYDFLKGIGYSNMWVGVAEEDRKINKFAERLSFKYIGTSDRIKVYEYAPKGDK